MYASLSGADLYRLAVRIVFPQRRINRSILYPASLWRGHCDSRFFLRAEISAASKHTVLTTRSTCLRTGQVDLLLGASCGRRVTAELPRNKTASPGRSSSGMQSHCLPEIRHWILVELPSRSSENGRQFLFGTLWSQSSVESFPKLRL